MQKRALIKLSSRKLFSIVLLTSLPAGAFPAAAQKRRPKTGPIKAPATKPVSTSRPDGPGADNQAPRCNGGWSGVVTFKKTLKADYNSKKKNVAKGTTHHITIRDYKYAGRIVVDGSDAKKMRTRAGLLERHR
jgi:hypothetical protein